jgi:hypothetical protein
MERVTGIEPASTAWEAVVLPMNYTRMSKLAADHTQACNETDRSLRLACPGAAE